jgi:predicted transcriptional regulator
VLAPNRTATLQDLLGAGRVTLREAARWFGRDFRAVRADLCLQLQAGGL